MSNKQEEKPRILERVLEKEGKAVQENVSELTEILKNIGTPPPKDE